ncbi:MAG: transcriptional regulator protein [Candidatus Methanoperedens sp.]|nr:transcriptional regulator protein [Candidatus Methanoperedens sp.]
MKNLKIKQLDEKGEEIADALMSLGLSRNISMSLAFLQNMNTATSLDLERSARLRQPEVSIAMRELKERDWVDEREEKKPGKGRPFKIYTLKVGFDEIVAQLEKEQKKAVEESQKKIRRLKELGK